MLILFNILSSNCAVWMFLEIVGTFAVEQEPLVQGLVPCRF